MNIQFRQDKNREKLKDLYRKQRESFQIRIIDYIFGDKIWK